MIENSNKILTKDYSFKRIIRKILLLVARKTPLLPGEYRVRLVKWGGVNIKDYRKVFIGYDVAFDDLHPELISVGQGTIITEGTKILSHFLDVSYNDYDHQYVGEVRIGANVFIGMNSVIVKPVTIGNGAVIGANSVINKDIPPYTIWGGNPIKFISERNIQIKER
ncbi:MAG: acyltransferase [Melioribacteraceae bacterium]|nr:acyltransferase [Melioribacteraceae bacterium]